MSDRMASVTEASSPSIKSARFAWSWCGTNILVGYEVSGPDGAG